MGNCVGGVQYISKETFHPSDDAFNALPLSKDIPDPEKHIEYIKSEYTEIYQPRLGADIITLAIDSLKKSKNALKSIFCDQVWIKHYNFAHKEVINDFWIQFWLVSHEFRKPLEANFSVLYVSSSRHVFTNFSKTKLQIFSPIFLS